MISLTQNWVFRLGTGSSPEAVPLEPVVRVSSVESPVPMFTVAPGRSLPDLSSLACRRTLAALNGSVIDSRVVAPGVTMTSWSATTSWSGLPEAVSLSR